MIPRECKRLAEVDFPVAVVSKHSAREKSIRHGHPSTLHLWWARRPLAACRAMLLGLLLPDPCDPHCPDDFNTQTRNLLPKVQGKVGDGDKELRQALLKFIGEFSNWDLSSNQTYLEVGRGLVKAAHPEETPLVVDPFAGGGSIPLEALRLGCEAFASDLNPVACLILKVMLEDIPRWGRQKVKVKRQNGEEVEADGLAEALRIVGKEIKEKAEEELRDFYPDDPDGSKPIAYLWARTVRCEAPNCGAEIPLVRSFWLGNEDKGRLALRLKSQCGKDGQPETEFEIFEPKSPKEVSAGTVNRAVARCPCCSAVLSPERVRWQLGEQRGGADVLFNEEGVRRGGARLLSVVCLQPEKRRRHYRLPMQRDYDAVWRASRYLKESTEGLLENGLSIIPDEPLPQERARGSSGFRILLYGMENFGDLFTCRQKLALNKFIYGVSMLPSSAPSEAAIKSLAAIAVSRSIPQWCALSWWQSQGDFVVSAFGRQALPIVWDFAECVPVSDASGGYDGAVEWLARVAGVANAITGTGQSQLADAARHPLPDGSTAVWFTDPPYYDAVAYADLSDFFFVWLKRMLREESLFQAPLGQQNGLTPKQNEIIVDPARFVGNRKKDHVFFERKMVESLINGRRALQSDGIGCIVFAHKTTEGWESLLSSILQAGWVVTASWPIATERGARPLAHETAALAGSVHLVCRPRPDDAPVGDWGDVLIELPRRVGDWMERLQSEGIRGADLVFACIGPALEIFSRYSKVETAEGREVGLPEFLEKVWEVVGRTALNQILGSAQGKSEKEKGKMNGAGQGLEEDARLTALFLWTLQTTNGEGKSEKEKGKREEEDEEEIDEEDEEGEEAPKKKKQGYSLIFDVVRRFAQPLGIHLPEWEGRIIETEKGIVRLLSVRERARQLFGEASAQAFAQHWERMPAGPMQLKLALDDRAAAPEIKGRGRERQKRATQEASRQSAKTEREATTLDRVHAAMILQANGQSIALRVLLKAEQDRGPDFLRLANALSALYPKRSEEKRLLDAMLVAMPR